MGIDILIRCFRLKTGLCLLFRTGYPFSLVASLMLCLKARTKLIRKRFLNLVRIGCTPGPMFIPRPVPNAGQ
jgi:hypothetical protein